VHGLLQILWIQFLANRKLISISFVKTFYTKELSFI
jgi:hypothetical protein